MKKLIAVLLFSIIAVPSLAQEPADADRACSTLTSIFGESQELKIGQVRRVGDDTCEFQNIVYSGIPRLAYEIDRVVVSKIDFKSLAEAKLPPSLRIEAIGGRPVPQIGSAPMKYFMRQTMISFHTIIDYDHDRANNVLHINEISLKDPYDIRVRADLANVGDLDELRKQFSVSPLALGAVSLKSLNFYYDDQGFFVRTILMSLGLALIDQNDPDPEATIEELRRTAIARTEAVLSQTETTRDSIAAVTALVAALPKPKKIFELSVVPSRPISPLEIAGKYAQPDEMKKILKSIALTASYRDGAVKCVP